MNKLYNDTAVQAIANAIRAKNGSSDTYTIAEMSTALNDISYYAKPTISNVPLATFEADGLPLNSLKASIVAKQAGSGTPSPENVRPISGWDAVNVSDVDDVDNPTVTQTTTITLGQTVYGGELDVVNGTSGNKMTHGFVDLGTLNWGEQGNPNTFQALITDFAAPSNDLMCEIYPVVDYAISGANMPDKSIKSYGASIAKYIIIKDSSYSTPSDLTTGISGYKLRYPLATPTTFETQPTPIKSLNGQNNLSVDTGEVIELEYFKEV